uniref:Vitellogenin n=1 Tax=Romanomermis culicivorax TaxID=13658 RepID=A0A915L6T7_ROMCU
KIGSHKKYDPVLRIKSFYTEAASFSTELYPVEPLVQNLLPVELTAEFKDIAVLEIQVTMERFKITTKIERNIRNII